MTHQLMKLNYSHDALIDQIMANPAATNRELGRVFDRTPEWVGMVKNSGAFREMYVERMRGIADPILAATINDRLEMMTARSLEVLNEKLAKPVEEVSDGLALAAAALGAKAQGIGGFGAKVVAAVVPPEEGRIERLASRLLNLGRQETTDVCYTELSQASPERPGASASG